MVKKIILGLLLTIFSLGLIAQEHILNIDNKINLNIGAKIGANGDFIDSITVNTDTMWVYAAGTEYKFVTYGSDASSLPSGTEGEVLYHNGTDWITLSTGENGQFLATTGSAPEWVTASSVENTRLITSVLMRDSIPFLADSNTYNTNGYLTRYWAETNLNSGGTSYDSVYVYEFFNNKIDSLGDIIDENISDIENQAIEIAALWASVGSRPPYALSFEIGDYNDSIALILFNRSLHSDSIPALTAITVLEDGDTIGINEIDINYDSLFIALDSSISENTTLLFSYTQTYHYLQDSSNIAVLNCTNKTVTNNVNIPTLGDELLPNTTFATDLSGWGNSGGWSWESPNGARHTAGTASNLYDNGFPTETDIRVSFTVTDMTAGSFLVNIGGTTGSTTTPSITADGDYTYDLTSGTSNDILKISPTTDFDGKITFISAKEIL